MSLVLGLDPGTDRTAWVLYDSDTKTIHGHGWDANAAVLEKINDYCRWSNGGRASAAIEMIASYGMAVGKEVFQTCVWIGRFVEAAKRACCPVEFVYRKTVKQTLCGSMKAKDGNIRQALIDRIGPPKVPTTKDTKKGLVPAVAPGPTAGIASHEWAALGVAYTFAEVGGEAA